MANICNGKPTSKHWFLTLGLSSTASLILIGPLTLHQLIVTQKEFPSVYALLYFLDMHDTSLQY